MDFAEVRPIPDIHPTDHLPVDCSMKTSTYHGFAVGYWKRPIHGSRWSCHPVVGRSHVFECPMIVHNVGSQGHLVACVAKVDVRHHWHCSDRRGHPIRTIGSMACVLVVKMTSRRRQSLELT